MKTIHAPRELPYIEEDIADLNIVLDSALSLSEAYPEDIFLRMSAHQYLAQKQALLTEYALALEHLKQFLGR